MSDLVELKPCPFCGGPAEIVDIDEGENAGGSCVCCTSCLASGNVEFEFKENFVSNWNRRATDPELSRLSALVAWQDIETAPKDGTEIIGAFWTIRWADSHRRGDIVRCWYQPEFGAFISSAREMTLAPGLTFEDGTSRQIHSPVIEPVTHWMHLHPFTAAKEG